MWISLPRRAARSSFPAGRCYSGAADVYLCGPPPMMDAAVAALTAAGVPADQSHLERFVTSL